MTSNERDTSNTPERMIALQKTPMIVNLLFMILCKVHRLYVPRLFNALSRDYKLEVVNLQVSLPKIHPFFICKDLK